MENRFSLTRGGSEKQYFITSIVLVLALTAGMSYAATNSGMESAESKPVASASALGFIRPRIPPPPCAVKLTVIEVSKGPVITKGHPGTEGIKYGLEGGCAFKHAGKYHMFTAEGIGDPIYVKMRLGHWTSPDRVNWTRVATLGESSGDYTGVDLKAAIWAPMPFYVETENRWHMYYVAYRAQPDDGGGWRANYDGRIIHAVAQTAGADGLNGTWKDVGIAMEPDWEPWKADHSQPWEGMQGVDSISPPYRASNGKWMAIYGSCQTNKRNQNPKYNKWNNGMAEAPAPTGPWRRCPEGNPLAIQVRISETGGETGYCENPIVRRLEDGLYLMVYDNSTIVGYATSPDGLHWSRAENVEVPENLKGWKGRTITPLGFIAEPDGTGTIFFMTPEPKNLPRWESLWFVRVNVERQ